MVPRIYTQTATAEPTWREKQTDQHKNALSRSINQLVEPFLHTVIMKNIFLQARQKNEDAWSCWHGLFCRRGEKMWMRECLLRWYIVSAASKSTGTPRHTVRPRETYNWDIYYTYWDTAGEPHTKKNKKYMPSYPDTEMGNNCFFNIHVTQKTPQTM